MSWPVHDCLMIEPTESEDKGEMDRLVDSLLAIREEISLIENGTLDKQNNPLKVRNPFQFKDNSLEALTFRIHFI